MTIASATAARPADRGAAFQELQAEFSNVERRAAWGAAFDGRYSGDESGLNALPRDPAALEGTEFDVVVVGGGLQGACIAWRTAEAGFRTALVDRGLFGSENCVPTIVHSGIRDLKHLNLRRMRATIRARNELATLSPDLVKPSPCFMPLPRKGLASPWIVGSALVANDWLSSSSRDPAPSRRGSLVGATRSSTLAAPLAELQAGAGAICWEAHALDAASLSLDLLRAATDAGAVVVSHLEARGLRMRGGAMRGVTARDLLTEKDIDVHSRVVVDASGASAGRLAGRAGLPTSYLPRGWVGAMSVILARSLGLEMAVALPAAPPPADARAPSNATELFFVPWNGMTLIGTHYRALRPTTGGFAPERSGATPEDVAAFVAAIQQVAPRAGVSAADIVQTNWGVLPSDLPGTRAPRDSAIVAADAMTTGATGLVVALAGENCVGAPAIAERVLRRVAVMVTDARHAARRRHPGRRYYRMH